jgi:SAM-dependent methyltransferase
MIELARKANPDLRFEVGSMAALDIADGALGGVLSRSSIIHTPPKDLQAVIAEFARVLAPGGQLLISCFATDDPAIPTQSFDHSVVTAYRWSPDHLAGLLRATSTSARPPGCYANRSPPTSGNSRSCGCLPPRTDALSSRVAEFVFPAVGCAVFGKRDRLFLVSTAPKFATLADVILVDRVQRRELGQVTEPVIIEVLHGMY